MVKNGSEGTWRYASDTDTDPDGQLRAIRHRISALTKSMHGGLSESEEKEYDDLTRLELDIVERLN